MKRPTPPAAAKKYFWPQSNVAPVLARANSVYKRNSNSYFTARQRRLLDHHYDRHI